MKTRKIVLQAVVGGILFTVISVLLERSYTQEVWQEKAVRGFIFGLLYALFLLIRERFINTQNK